MKKGWCFKKNILEKVTNIEIRQRSSNIQIIKSPRKKTKAREQIRKIVKQENLLKIFLS